MTHNHIKFRLPPQSADPGVCPKEDHDAQFLQAVTVAPSLTSSTGMTKAVTRSVREASKREGDDVH